MAATSKWQPIRTVVWLWVCITYIRPWNAVTWLHILGKHYIMSPLCNKLWYSIYKPCHHKYIISLSPWNTSPLLKEIISSLLLLLISPAEKSHPKLAWGSLLWLGSFRKSSQRKKTILVDILPNSLLPTNVLLSKESLLARPTLQSRTPISSIPLSALLSAYRQSEIPPRRPLSRLWWRRKNLFSLLLIERGG